MAKKDIAKFRDLLNKCHVEDDVRAAYAKFFNIPFDASDYMDLYTPHVLFEFKFDKNLSKSSDKARVLAQALYYVRRLYMGDMDEINSNEQKSLFDMAKLMEKIRPVSPIICLADVNEAILTETDTWESFYKDDCYNWHLSPSSPDQRLIARLAVSDELKKVHTYNFSNDIDLQLFADLLTKNFDNQLSITSFKTKKKITERNFEKVYKYWESLFGDAVRNGYKPSRYFVSDIQEGNTMFIPTEGKALFNVDNKFIAKKILSKDYDYFWSIFDKVSDIDTIRGILSKVDRLTDESLRRFQGEFFTPIPFATKALDYIEETIGKNWWESGEYRLWDMAAGTGNLEYNLPSAAWKYCYLSTLLETDVEHLSRLFPDANVFQYNYLNDDIDYIAAKVQQEKDNLADKHIFASYQKLPQSLVDDLANPNIKWIVLINPPFATSQTAGAKGESKAGVSATKIRELMHKSKLGEVSRELFSQFLFRIKYEFKGKQAHLALFSKIKYINSTNDQKFRDSIFDFQFVKGFVFSSLNFSGTSRVSQFPVGMLIWNLSYRNPLNQQDIILKIFDTHQNEIGEKTILAGNRTRYLSKWIVRPTCTTKFPPFGSAIEIKDKNKDRRDRIAEGFLASLMCAGNDFQAQNQTFFLSAPAASAGALSVTKENFEQAMIVHSARRVPHATWLNDRDQFLAPKDVVSNLFVVDCALWTLFSSSNNTAALKNVEYEGVVYQIHNNFFPFAVADVKKWNISDPDIRQSLLSAEDTFMAKWLSKQELSAEANELLRKGKEIYKFYFEHLSELRTPKFKIETWDAGWYQIRMALKDAELASDLLADIKVLHEHLRNKLLPQLKDYGIIG